MTQVSETGKVQTEGTGKRQKRQRKHEKSHPQEQTLDTSQLLRKKDDRNV